MTKKIVFIGPASTGKTSLRKVFFEGESSKKILAFSLEPTFGQESIVLNLQEMIGIFDLAGQENETWLEVNEDSILKGTRIMILVIDCTDTFENNLDFIKRVINLRDLIVQDCLIYILVHKIDLISENELYDLKLLMQDRLYYFNLINIAYTSIQRDYFADTFSVFIDILRKCTLQKIATEKIDINLVSNTIFSLNLINQNSLITKDELQYQLSVSNEEFKNVIDLLLNNKLLTIKELGDSILYKLTEGGISNIKRLKDNFSIDDFKVIDKSIDISRYDKSEKDLRFLGFFIATKTGIPIINAEIEDGYFETFLKSADKESTVDTDMISTLISALEMFSSELNIKDIPGFKLKGSNIMVKSFNYETVTISFVVKAGTNIKAIKNKIFDWFNSFLDRHSVAIAVATNTGNVSEMHDLALEGRQWLQDLNIKYKTFISDHEIFDINETQSLYEALDKIPLDSISQNEFAIVKKLKTELLRTSIEEDLHSLKELSKKIKEL